MFNNLEVPTIRKEGWGFAQAGLLSLHPQGWWGNPRQICRCEVKMSRVPVSAGQHLKGFETP